MVFHRPGAHVSVYQLTCTGKREYVCQPSQATEERVFSVQLWSISSKTDRQLDIIRVKKYVGRIISIGSSSGKRVD